MFSKKFLLFVGVGAVTISLTSCSNRPGYCRENEKITVCYDASDNLFSGNIKKYHENGKLKMKTPYKKGKKEGVEKWYYADGRLKAIVLYKNGEQGVTTEYKYYKNGNLWNETSYKNGKKDGEEKQFYKNGKLQKQILYENGKATGVEKWYHEDGRLWSKTPYSNGLPDGVKTEYYENGRLKEAVVFKNGTPVSGVSYDADGYETEMTKAHLQNINAVMKKYMGL